VPDSSLTQGQQVESQPGIEAHIHLNPGTNNDPKEGDSDMRIVALSLTFLGNIT
jgi:hypothetical protein